MSFWQTVRAVVWKDVRVERHTGRTLSVMTAFSLAAVVTFNLAVQGDLAAARNVSAGLLWVTVLLAGTLGLNRSFAGEQENATFDALLISPADRSALYVGKVISVTLFTLVLELILLFVFTVVFNRPFLNPAVFGVLALGTVGYVAAGVLITAMTIQTRARDVLLPVLLLPLSLPVVLAAATATVNFINLADPTWNDVGFPIALVVLYDVMMLTAGFFTYEFVVAE